MGQAAHNLRRRQLAREAARAAAKKNAGVKRQQTPVETSDVKEVADAGPAETEEVAAAPKTKLSKTRKKK